MTSRDLNAEREALLYILLDNPNHEWEGERGWVLKPRRAVEAILAAGFRLPAQTEPTDAQVQAAIQGRYAAFRQNVHATETHLMRAALKAAFTAEQGEPTDDERLETNPF